MLRKLAWIELVIAALALAITLWPVSGFCFGKTWGQDCESWFIFGVNFFGPVGLLFLACSTWTLNRRSTFPQYVLVFGLAMVAVYWILQV